MAGINTSYGNYYSYPSYGGYGANRANSSSYVQQKAINDFLNTSYKNNASSIFSFLPSLKESAGSFNSAVKSLTSKSSSGVFSQKSALSSNNDVLTAKFDNKLSNVKSMDVSVTQIALAQKNEGKSLASSSKTIASGSYGFAVDIGGKSHTFSINVTDKDNDKSILQKMADTVNAKNIGIKASVQNDTSKNTSKLVFEAANTGAADGKDRFSIRDLNSPSGSTGLVAATDTGSSTQKAQNAIYSVNGGAVKTSQSNDVALGSGVSATLKSASNEPVKITFGKDAEAIKTKVNDFVKSYNSLLSTAKDSSSQKLISSLSGATGMYSTSLSAVGIEKDSSGKLSINSDRLDASIQNGSLERIFDSKQNYGFGSRMESISSSIERNPMAYATAGSLLTTYNIQSNLNNYYPSLFSGQLFNYML